MKKEDKVINGNEVGLILIAVVGIITSLIVFFCITENILIQDLAFIFMLLCFYIISEVTSDKSKTAKDLPIMAGAHKYYLYRHRQ